MKYITIILAALFVTLTISCATYGPRPTVEDPDRVYSPDSNAFMLPPIGSGLVGAKQGWVLLRTGRKIYFIDSAFSCNHRMIRIESEQVHMTILWYNVQEISLTNGRSTCEEK